MEGESKRQRVGSSQGVEAVGEELVAYGCTDINDTDGKIKSGKSIVMPTGETKYKNRLFIGEGSFSYTVAFLEKHPMSAGAITATEFRSEDDLVREYGDVFRRNIAYCRDRGVEIMFGVNATKLAQDERFRGVRFKRIQFNFPWRGHRYVTTPPVPNTVSLLKDFFLNAAKLQSNGGHVRVTLPKNPEDEKIYYCIGAASKEAGYKKIEKHKFRNRSYKGTDSPDSSSEPERYKGYRHERTEKKAQPGPTLRKEIRDAVEHVFERAEDCGAIPSPAIVTDCDYSSDVDEVEQEKIGNCLFDAIAKFIDADSTMLRARAVQHISVDEQLREAINMNARNGDRLNTPLGEKQYDNVVGYQELMKRDQTWGTYIELVALSRALNRTIRVYFYEQGFDMLKSVYDINVDGESLDKRQPIALDYNGWHYRAHELPDTALEENSDQIMMITVEQLAEAIALSKIKQLFVAIRIPKQ